MVDMKCIDYFKANPLWKVILAVIAFAFILTGVFGYVIVWTREIDFYKKYTVTKRALFATIITLTFIDSILWVFWLMWYNFNVEEHTTRLLYYGAITTSILTLIFVFVVMVLLNITHGDVLGIWIVYTIGVIISLILQFCL